MAKSKRIVLTIGVFFPSHNSMSKYHVKIAQAGETVDGRTIKESWLRDIAESYNTKEYTAMIWPEHRRYFGNYGQVSAVTLKEEGNKVCLYADLEPNQSLLWENAYGQKLFYSLEVDTNFAKTGKAYLTGLAVTDSPASLGLEAHRFSQTSQLGEHLESVVYLSNTQIGEKLPEETHGNEVNQPGDLGESNIPGWFKSLIFGKQKQDKGTQGMHEKLKALEQGMADLNNSFGELAGKFDTFFANIGTLPESAVVVQPATQPEAQAAADKLKEEYSAQFADITARLDDLVACFEQAQGATEVPPHTGAEAKPVY